MKMWDYLIRPIPDPKDRKAVLDEWVSRGKKVVMGLAWLVLATEILVLILILAGYGGRFSNRESLIILNIMVLLSYIAIYLIVNNKFRKYIYILMNIFPYICLFISLSLSSVAFMLGDTSNYMTYLLFLFGTLIMKTYLPIESLILYSISFISITITFFLYSSDPHHAFALIWVNILLANLGVFAISQILFRKYRSDFYNRKQLLHQENQLRELVHEKTIAETLMRRAKEEADRQRERAEQAAQAKSLFLANMSHEIRTPMNAVIGLNDLLARTPLNPKQQDYVQKVGSAAKNLLRILNDILDTSKIESGKMTLEKNAFFLEDVLENLSSLLGKKAHEKGVELVLANSPETPPCLVGDSLRLGQVLLNLCANALKFTEKGEVVLSIHPIEVTERNATILFEVRDSGIGMTDEQVSRLFTAFSQADASTTRRFGGTGLGLMISKNIVELMGGKMQVHSEAGKGSVFSFQLPFEIGSSQQKKMRKDLSSLQGKKVLVVEDHDATRQVINEYLTSFGMDSVLVCSGEEAVQVAVKGVDLILMDWKLGGIDGIQAWNQIKDLISPDKVPKILFITAYEKEEVLQHLSEEEKIPIITKPVNPSTLMDKIMDLFGREPREPFFPSHPDPVVGIDINSIRGARILLVEDNEINQQVARETLEAEGFWVEGAENGQVAWEKARNNSYDLILMDLQMPVLDGIEATLQIRSDPSIRKDLPIIALSADVMSQTREKVTEAGMNGSIPKPIDPLQLFETLKKWIPEATREPFIPPQPSQEIDETQDEQDQIPQMRRMMPSIQVDVGLKRISNNHRLYKEILGKFLRNYEDFGKEWKENLDIANTEDVARKLHTLKGVAANIGAMKVQNLSEKLETLVIEGESILENPLFEALLEALEESQREIETYLIQQERIQKTSRAAQSYNREELVQRCKELEEALASYDTKAEEILAQVRPSLEAHLGDNETKAMEKALSAYDFDKAGEICHKILEIFEGVFLKDQLPGML